VQGVLLASEDQVGRPCPLIIYQQIAPGWLRRSWSARASLGENNMLYWLSRIAARTHGADRSWDDLTRAVDSVWALHRPGWTHWMGAPLPAPSSLQLDSVLRQYCEDDGADVARGLHGVQHMPWVNWPAQILGADQPGQAFWQQDMRGGYINASDNLPSLWRTRT
jgi:type VI secretion system protein ImpM